MSKIRLYTHDDDSFICLNYPFKGASFCADQLGRTYDSIVTRAFRLGVKSDKFKIPISNINKVCGKCQEEKSKNAFGIDKARKDNLNCFCKICLLKYRFKSKSKKAKYDLKYRQKNKEILKIKNRIKVKKYWATNINFRLKSNLRRRIRDAIYGFIKSQKTKDLIGCDINFLKQYIESLWKEGMSWENYGKWHIDHIKPCASFNLSLPEQQKICFNYNNLQPLWAKENILKGSKFIQ